MLWSLKSSIFIHLYHNSSIIIQHAPIPFCCIHWRTIRVINFIKILWAAFAPIFLHQKIKSQTVTGEKLRKALSYKKVLHKMLTKLTPCRWWCHGRPLAFFSRGGQNFPGGEGGKTYYLPKKHLKTYYFL